ncbi:hypothetical protein [Streptomyces sp. NPDC005970]
MKAAVLTAPRRIETVDDWPECARGLTSACTERAIVGMNAPRRAQR